ncbi:benzoate transport protein [Vibrio cholerae]|nr:benzoate transport protein [Vibrio cholerae]
MLAASAGQYSLPVVIGAFMFSGGLHPADRYSRTLCAFIY